MGSLAAPLSTSGAPPASGGSLPSAAIKLDAVFAPTFSSRQPYEWGGATVPLWQDAPFTWDNSNNGWDLAKSGIYWCHFAAIFNPNDGAAADYPNYFNWVVAELSGPTVLKQWQRSMYAPGQSDTADAGGLFKMTAGQILGIEISTGFSTTAGTGAFFSQARFEVAYLGAS